jgi:hypothetical protein
VFWSAANAPAATSERRRKFLQRGAPDAKVRLTAKLPRTKDAAVTRVANFTRVLAAFTVATMSTGCTDEPGFDHTRTALAAVDLAAVSDLTLAPGEPVAGLGPPSHGMASGAGVHFLITGGDDYAPLGLRFASDDLRPLDHVAQAFSGQHEKCAFPGGAAVGFGDGVFLVVWSAYKEMCSVRFKSDGTMLDAQPHVLMSSYELKAPAAITFDGNNFLLTFYYGTNGDIVGQPKSGDIHAIRIRPSDGVVLDTQPIEIVNVIDRQQSPAVVFDGTNHFVIWHDLRGSGTIMGARVRPDGQVLDQGGGFTVSPAQGMYVSPALAVEGGGTNLLVAWQEGPYLRARHMRPDGTGVEPASFDIAAGTGTSTEAMFPRVLWDGSRYLVFWRGSTGMRRGLLDARVAAVGTEVSAPRVFATFTEPPYVYGTFGISSHAGKHLVTWADGRTNNHELYGSGAALNGAFVDAETGLPTSAPVLLSRSGREQHTPFASFDGRQHLFTYVEWDGAGLRVRGARVSDTDAAVLDPAGIAIARDPGLDDFFPLSASNGRTHLVVWQHGADVHAARVRGDDGVVLDNPPASWPARQQPKDADGRPGYGVASNGTDYLVVWSEGGVSSPENVVKAVRLAGDDGRVLSGPTQLAIGTRVTSPALSYVGSHYLLTWVEPGASTARVRAQRFDALGAAVGSAVDLAPPSTSWVVRDLTVTPTTTGALVSWLDNNSWKGRLVRTDGTPEEGMFALDGTAGTNFAHGAATAFDGTHFVTLRARYGFYDLNVAIDRLSATGTPLDPTPVMLANDPDWWESDVAISAGTGGRLVAGYVRFDPASPAGTWRLHLRPLGYPAGPPPVVDAGPPPAVDAGPPPAVDAGPPPAVDAGPPPVVDAVPPKPDADVGADMTSPTADAAPGGDASDAAAEVRPDVISEGPIADANTGGGATDAGADARADAGDDHDGMACGCRVGGSAPGRAPAVAWLLAPSLALLVHRRRRTLVAAS